MQVTTEKSTSNLSWLCDSARLQHAGSAVTKVDPFAPLFWRDSCRGSEVHGCAVCTSPAFRPNLSCPENPPGAPTQPVSRKVAQQSAKKIYPRNELPWVVLLSLFFPVLERYHFKSWQPLRSILWPKSTRRHRILSRWRKLLTTGVSHLGSLFLTNPQQSFPKLPSATHCARASAKLLRQSINSEGCKLVNGRLGYLNWHPAKHWSNIFWVQYMAHTSSNRVAVQPFWFIPSLVTILPIKSIINKLNCNTQLNTHREQ